MVSSTRSYAGRTGEERAARRRTRLVEATVRLLAREGEARATMTAICGEAGLTERYFYESFRNRDDALAAALDHVAARIAAVAEQAVAETPGSPTERARAAVTAVVELAEREPDVARVAIIESSANARLREVRRRQVHAFADLVQHHATDLFGDAALPPGRLRLRGLAFIAGFAELVHSWLVGELEIDAEELAAVGLDLFVSLCR